MESEVKRTCILHLGDVGRSAQSIKPFDEARWEKTLTTVKARKNFLKTTKYDDLLNNFPETCEPTFGYHSTCYKNFTAVPKSARVTSSTCNSATNSATNTTTNSNQEVRPRSKRSESNSLRESSSGVLVPKCIFCDCVKRRNEHTSDSLEENAEAKVRTAARARNDEKVLIKIGSYDFGSGPDFTALEVKYHKLCYVNYLNHQRPSTSKSNSNLKKKATKSLLTHIDQLVIKENIAVTLQSLLLSYKEFFLSCGGDAKVLDCYTVQNLGRKLSKHRGNALTIVANKNKSGTIVFKTNGMTFEEASDLVSTSEESSQHVIRQCAQILRRDILTSEKKPLDTSSVDGIMEGEVAIPQNVNLFYKKLYNGEEGAFTAQKQRFANSSAADAVYCCSSTKLLPGKHISHAMALKSITGSRRVVTLEQRNGHCASNETVRRVEMGLEESLMEVEVNCFVPDGIVKRPGLCMGTAWDNFDVNIETLNGLGTIHHTYGIVYQNISDGIAYIPAGRKRRDCGRQFSKVKDSLADDDVEPYYKKPKITEHEFERRDFLPPRSYSINLTRNLLWSVAKSLFPQDIPMWHGWNSLKEVDINPQQKVMYLQRIKLPPTRNDVVKETMRRSQMIAAECGEKYALVTYDLAVAKIAKQIQATEAPLFENVFVMFGSFHTEMSFFGSIGRMIEGSGGPFVLSEAEIVAPGSMNKFLKGKMYNRCRRVHILMSTAMHSLHFQSFVENDTDVTDETKDVLKKWVMEDDNDFVPECLELLSVKYGIFCDETISGARGKTAQFWMTYCQLIDLYLLFHGAMKSCDVDLFAYALHEMSSVFFSTNHLNYAKWMTRYCLELENIDIELRKMLIDGGFSVRRSKGPFCRVGVDMALEQTINAEAKNRLKGIIAFADVNTAVNRWLVTSTMRTEIVNKVLDLSGLGPNDDETITKETLPTRIKRDSRDLENICNSIRQMINPFDPFINQNVLFNIKTGRKASPDAEKYLLSVVSDGETRRDAFMKECSEDQGRFQKSIKQSKIVNFASENFVKKNKSKKASEIAHLKGTRDLFARLLYLAIAEKGLGEEKVIAYPLTPEPAEFVHPDGTIRTTKKSAIANLLNVVKVGPDRVENVIIDGMFFLRNLTVPLPHTLRGLVRHILMRALKMASRRIDLVLDTYKSPCLKDIARDLRGDDLDDSDEVYNFGSGQKTPSNFLSLLKYSNFKKEFLSFFYKEIKNNEYANIFGDKTFYCSVDNECVRLQCDEDGGLQVDDVHELYGDHDEADTRVAFHALHAEVENPGNIVIRCNDNDVLVIMLTNIHKFNQSRVWLDLGLDYNNSRHYVDLKLTADLTHFITALAGIYNLSGNDYIPCFYKKGKARPIKLMLTSEEYIRVFSKMGEEDLTDEDFDVLEKFVCALFGYKKLKSINEARYLHFKNKCKPKESSKPLDFLKNVDPSLFPPCRDVLVQQIKRAWYVTKLYKNATAAEPVADYTLLDYGYQLLDGHVHLKWFDGEQLPQEAEDDNEGDVDMEGSEDENDEEVSDVSDEEGSEDDEEDDSSDEDL